MTGDMGEIFNAMRELKKEKKRGNLQSSTELLTERGVRFDSRNNGVHLIVQGNGHIADFWPSTGLWIVRGGRQGRGVFGLLKLVQLKAPASETQS